MITHLRINCDHCQRMLKVPVEYLNKRVICNHCDHSFLAKPDDKEHPYSPLRFAITTTHPDGARILSSLAPSETAATSGAPDAAPRRTGLPRDSRDQPGVPALRAEIDRLRAEIEDHSVQAAELSRVKAELARACADRDHHRDSVRILQADIIARAAETERLEARFLKESNELREAAGDEIRTLQATVGTLRDRVETLTLEQERIAAEHAETRSERDRIAREREQTAAAFRAARTRVASLEENVETLSGEVDRLRSDLDAANRQAEASCREQERHQAEAARLHAEIEQQRLRREQERQQQHEALAALKKSLADRLQARTARPQAGADEARAEEIPASAEVTPPPEVEPLTTVDDQLRALRSHLRNIHETELKEKVANPALVSRLARILRPDGPKPSSD